MEIKVQALNANYINKGCVIKLKQGTLISDFKEQIIKKSFFPSVAPKVTNLVFIKDLKGAPQKTHTTTDIKGKSVFVYVKEDFPDNIDFFDKKYEDCDAYDIFVKNDIRIFYYIAQLLNLSVTVKGRIIEYQKIQPLKFKNNNLIDLANDVATENGCGADDVLFFVNNKYLDKIDSQNDLKEYASSGLIAYTYPIAAKFSYSGLTKVILLKFDEPLSYYISNFDIKKSLKIEFSNLLFTIQGDELPEGFPEYFRDDFRIHQLLKKYYRKQINIKIEEGNSIYDTSEKQMLGKNTNKISNEESSLNEKQYPKIIKDLKNQLKEKEKLIASYFSPEAKNRKEDNYIIGADIEETHKILGKIGEGATSITYKVIDINTQKIMCKKILKITNNSTFQDQFNATKEFEVLYTINHPCICHAFGYNPTEPVQDSTEAGMTTIAIFLEYLEYSLKECLEKNILNDTFKAKIVVEVAHGMNYIHKLKMIHRDLKIENIMLNPVYEAKIIDFGLARVEEISQDSLTKGVGTFHYMSPEMANQEDYDIKTDVYSFGICVYYIFTGKHPEQSLRDKLNGKPISLPKPSTTISPFCIELISKCTSPRPDDRPTFIDIIEDMKRHSFMLSSNVDSEIVSHRNQELEIINQINEK